MSFQDTHFEESNINRKPLIKSHDKIVMQFGPKNQAGLVWGKVYENFQKMKKKVLFYKTYFEESNIDQIPLIWTNDKIVIKFGPKNG